MKITLCLAFLFLFIQTKTFGQSGIIMKIPTNDTLLLKGDVTVLHGPDHYYRDTTIVKYVHYILIYKQGDTIKYHEIFDSPHRDSLMFDSYAFQVKNDTMYFFTEKEFLNFTGFGKTLFLSYPQHSPEKSINSTPKILTTDTTNRWGVDTSYFYFSKFNEKDIIEESEEFIFKEGEITDSIAINLFKSIQMYEFTPGLGNAKTHINFNIKKISGVLDSSGYYTNIEYCETRKCSVPNSSYTQIYTIYSRMDNVPHKTLNYLKQ